MAARRSRLIALQARAADQLGCFSTDDAEACDVTRAALHRLRKAGIVTAAAPRVYRFAAAPETQDGAVVAALLAAGPGTAVARWSTLRLLGVSCAPSAAAGRARPACPTIELVREDSTPLAIPGVTVHRTRSLLACDVTRLDRAPAILLTTAARSLVDLCWELEWTAIASLVDEIICGRHASRRWLHTTAVRLRNGRPNVGTLIRLTRPGAEGEFWSWLERTSAGLWARHGIPAPEWNVEVRDDRGTIGIVDALWASQMVIVELEGLRFHTRPAQRRKDAERFNRLGKEHRVLRFTWLDVVKRPGYVVETLREALGVSPPSRHPRRG